MPTQYTLISGRPWGKAVAPDWSVRWWLKSANPEHFAESLEWGFILVQFANPPAFGYRSVAANSRISKVTSGLPLLHARDLAADGLNRSFTSVRVVTDDSTRISGRQCRSLAKIPVPLLRHQSDKYIGGRVREFRPPT